MTDVAQCDHCGHRFEVADDLAGGITNCPDCGKATEVQGSHDPLWRMAKIGGVLLIGAVAYGVYRHSGAVDAALAAIFSTLILWIVSRAL